MPDILATYRLQLHGGFTLADARALVPYLSRLGVSHIHCSPLLRSRRGSTHGYDVVDPTMLDPELGTDADLAALHQALAERGMGLVLDIVPNHMAASQENPAWEDVLAHGPASRYARWFDIAWRASEPDLRSRVLVPVLGDPRTQVLQRGEITLVVDRGVPRVRYFDHGFPLDPSTLPVVLRPALARCRDRLGAEHPRFNAENPTQIAGSYGGVAFMVLAVLYVLTMLALLFWPALTYVGHAFSGLRLSPRTQLQMAASLGAAAVLSLSIFLLAMRRGVRALEALG